MGKCLIFLGGARNDTEEALGVAWKGEWRDARGGPTLSWVPAFAGMTEEGRE